MKDEREPTFSFNTETEGQYHLFYEYIQISPNLSEIFNLWDFQSLHKITRWETILLDVFTRSLQLCKARPATRMNGESIIRYILRHHMNSLHRNLSSSIISVLIGTLRLFMIMSGFTLAVTQELFRSFIFDMKRLDALAHDRRSQQQWREKKDINITSVWNMNVRQLYVRFVLNFVHHSDSSFKKEVLEIKGFLQGLMKGLAEDDVTTASYVLKVLHENILEDSRLPRTVKVHFFSIIVLNSILQLYDRNEIHGDKIALAEKAHQFLLDLTTIRGKGICFADTGWYPREGENISNIYYNKTLSEWIHSIQPHKDLRRQSLLLSILKNCPELVACYWNTRTFSADAKPTLNWCARIALLTKVVALEPPLLQKSRVPPVSIVMANILPSAVHRSLLGHSLQSKNFFIRWMIVNFLIVVLKKLNLVCEIAMRFELGIWSQFRLDIVNETNRNLPDLQLVLSSYHSLAFPEIETSRPDPYSLLYLQYLKLIRLWRRLFPANFLEARYDPIRLMCSYRGETSLRGLIRTFLAFPELESLPDITYWLGVYTQMDTDDSLLESLEKLLILNFMETGFFEENSSKDEIFVWLHALRETKAPISNLLSNVISEACQHGLTYLDEHRRLIGGTSSQYSNVDLCLSPLLTIFLKTIDVNNMEEMCRNYLVCVVQHLISIGIDRSCIFLVFDLVFQHRKYLGNIIATLDESLVSRELAFSDNTDNLPLQLKIRQCATYVARSPDKEIDPIALDALLTRLIVLISSVNISPVYLKLLIDTASKLISQEHITLPLYGKKTTL